MTVANPDLRRRNRKVLIAVAVLFLGSFLAAGVLRFSGWRPAQLKNKGELLQPYADLRDLHVELDGGGAYPWQPRARRWRILVAPPAGCADACVRLSRQLDTVWQLFGHDADRVHVLWIGRPPAGIVHAPAIRVLSEDPTLRARLPRWNDPAGMPVYVVDPNGFAILRYAPGFDPGDLRTDVARLLKLR